MWKNLSDIKFKNFENIYRLADWIEGTTEISWDVIHKRDMKKKNAAKQNKHAELIGSREMIEAVQRNNTEKA